MNKHLTIHTPPKRILVIAMRFLGDVLLTTPLIHCLRRAYPESEIDVLVYSNTETMLEGNTDISQVITTPQRPIFSDHKLLFKRLFRQYDLAISTQTGDRRIIYALIAAPLRISFVPQRSQKGWWKRFFFQGWSEFATHTNHTVLELLKLSTLLNLAPSFSVIPPNTNVPRDFLHTLNLPKKYAVIHVHPQWQYKRWTTKGWIEIGHYLNELSITPVLTGSSNINELTYIESIQKHLPENTINITGKASLAELTHIIKHSQLFIGTDTGITHLAAATGTKVIAIYGPTNPLIWGPWPYNYSKNEKPYNKIGNQQINNIYLIQGTDPAGCVPCQEEGCEKNRQSFSRCLDIIEPQQVKEFIQLAIN